MELSADGNELHLIPHLLTHTAHSPWNTHKLLNPRGAFVRSGYSFFINPLWYRRAVSPRKHHYSPCTQLGHGKSCWGTDSLLTPH